MQHLVLQASDSGGAVVWGGLGICLVFGIIGLLGTIFWIWMLIDCLTSSMTTNEKLLWGLVIFFLHLLGAIIYFFVGRRGRGHVTS